MSNTPNTYEVTLTERREVTVRCTVHAFSEEEAKLKAVDGVTEGETEVDSEPQDRINIRNVSCIFEN